MTDRPAQSAPRCKPWCGLVNGCLGTGEDCFGRYGVCYCTEECREDERPNHPAPSAPPERPGEDTPWPLRDILTRLVQAASHLLHAHGCDCDRWETIQAAEMRDKVAAETSAHPCDPFCRYGVRPTPEKCRADVATERPGEAVRDVMVEAILRETGMDDICDRHGVVAALLNEPRLSITLRAAPDGGRQRCGAVYQLGGRPPAMECVLPRGHDGSHARWKEARRTKLPLEPDGGRLSERMHGFADTLTGDSRAEARVLAREVAELETKLSLVTSKLAAAERDVAHWKEARRTAMEDAEHFRRERDEAVARERSRFIELLETYEPRRDVPSDWSYQGALERIAAMVREP